MIETIFRFDQDNFTRCQEHYRGQRQRDYYGGEYTIDPSDFVEVQADKRTFGAASVVRLKSRSRLKFRRAWSHIRSDNIDLTILWFVRRGRIRFATTGAEARVARVGDFLLTRSATPFFMECLADEEGQHEVFHVTVPTHLIRPFIPSNVKAGLVIAAPAGRVEMARRIVVDLFADEEGISQDSALRLLEGTFSLLADAIADCPYSSSKELTIPEQRVEDVLRFINIHLSDPDLSRAMVCKGCSISPRYLSTLLQMRGTSFTAEVWGQRMAKAKAWLSTSSARDAPVSEVAHRLGFKSAAHFSRRFKQIYKHNPSERRAG